jgi:hypothetical protein
MVLRAYSGPTMLPLVDRHSLLTRPWLRRLGMGRISLGCTYWCGGPFSVPVQACRGETFPKRMYGASLIVDENPAGRRGEKMQSALLNALPREKTYWAPSSHAS